ncbi:hypothetical protein RJ55_05954 [Drechmeria coniospora]|nr:hypothetical protein RJ55_05954 [Drechmeria coniospora]
MAYDRGGYGGGAHQRPAQHAFNDRPPPVRHYESPQAYGDAYDDRGYDDRAGYGQDMKHAYQGNGRAPHGRPGPGHQYHGSGPEIGGLPMPPSRGAMPRPSTADGYRAGQPPRDRGGGPRPGPGPPRAMTGPGRGGPSGPYPPNQDHAGRRPEMRGPPGRREPGYGANEDIAGPMSDMSINGRRGGYPEAAPGPGGYPASGQYASHPADAVRGGRPRDFPPREFPDQRQGPPPGRNAGGYGGPREDFGHPSRSMTMPVNDSTRHNIPPRQRMDSVPVNGLSGQGMMMPRQGNRLPPQRNFSSNAQLPHEQAFADNDRSGYGRQQAPAAGGAFDTYGAPPRGRQPGYDAEPASRPTLPEFNSDPSQRGGRRSFDQVMRPEYGQPHAGPNQMPRLHHAKSEANIRQPQAAVFEMPGDIPSVPPMPPNPAGFSDGYGRSRSYDVMAHPPRGPAAPPAASQPSHGGVPRTQTGLSQGTNADSLPSHPTPVRPGLMAGSMVSLNDRSPPVRHYGGVPHMASPQSLPPQGQERMVARAGHQVPEVAPIEEPVSPQELERLRVAIKNNANDQEAALRLARKLIEAADVLAPNLPDPKQRTRARERYLLDAHKILKKLTVSQNQDAMFVMADGLGRGLFGNAPDNKEAFTLYQSAAKLGHAAAAYRTAVCCEIGNDEGGGTRKDPLKAMQWYKRSATLGDPPAMYKVGMILLKGLLGQPRNPREAVGWLKRAAEQADTENPHALHELGLLYESAQPNDAIVRDEMYALSLFQQAADLGYKFSQFRLGSTFEYGLMGCGIDPRKSIFWYSKAAAQEEHQSELALSGWYLTGTEGVLGQSDTEAYLWARKAAVAGLAKAEYAMGYFTEVGIGVPANLEDAKRWYWRAAAQDFPKARERLEDLKRAGKNGHPRQRERISRSRIGRQQEGECSIM